MGMWDEPIQDFEPLKPETKISTRSLFHEKYLEQTYNWKNIQETNNGKFIAYGRNSSGKVYLGTFETIEKAHRAQEEFKYSGERQVQQKKEDPLTLLTDLITYYFQSSPPGIKHSYLESAHIECGNDIGFFWSPLWFPSATT